MPRKVSANWPRTSNREDFDLAALRASPPRLRTSSCGLSPPTPPTGGKRHEAAPAQGHGGQGGSADLARSPELDDCPAHAIHADVSSRVRRDARYQAHPRMHIRSRGEPEQPSVAQAL